MAKALLQALNTNAVRTTTGVGGAGSQGFKGGAHGTAEYFVSLALQQAGDRYRLGAETRMSDPNPRVFDCSELVEWAAYRAGAHPRVPDGTGGQIAFARQHHLLIPVSRAIRIRGSVLWHSGHTGISLGIGSNRHGTIEAMGRKYGVLRGSSSPRRWTHAWLVPGLRY